MTVFGKNMALYVMYCVNVYLYLQKVKTAYKKLLHKTISVNINIINREQPEKL
jgi:hypothetical protein